MDSLNATDTLELVLDPNQPEVVEDNTDSCILDTDEFDLISVPSEHEKDKNTSEDEYEHEHKHDTQLVTRECSENLVPEYENTLVDSPPVPDMYMDMDMDMDTNQILSNSDGCTDSQDADDVLSYIDYDSYDSDRDIDDLEIERTHSLDGVDDESDVIYVGTREDEMSFSISDLLRYAPAPETQTMSISTPKSSVEPLEPVLNDESEAVPEAEPVTYTCVDTDELVGCSNTSSPNVIRLLETVGIYYDPNVYNESYTEITLNYIPYISSKHNGAYRVVYNCNVKQGVSKTYIGTLRDGRYHGFGKLIYGPTEFKQGYFHNGVFRKGIWVNGMNYQLGVFDHDLLHGDYSVLYTNGHIFKGIVRMGSPQLTEYTSSFDEKVRFHLLGFKGKITNSSVLPRRYENTDEGIIEGVFTVTMKKCPVISRLILSTCIYSDRYYSYGYIKNSANHILQIKAIVLKGGHKITYPSLYIQTIREGNNIYLYDYEYDVTPSLFHGYKRHVKTSISNTKSKEIEFTVPVPYPKPLLKQPVREWTTDNLMLWIMVNLPHFDQTIIRNIQYFRINGGHVTHMSQEQLGAMCPTYTDIKRNVFVTQIKNRVLRTTTTTNKSNRVASKYSDSMIEFYLEVQNAFPHYVDILRFIKDYCITKTEFLLLDETMLRSYFGIIPVFQINHMFRKYDTN